MPTVTVPHTIDNPAQAVEAKIAELEQGNAEISAVSHVGDQWLIVYKNKPRVGRPPKETRG